MNLFPPPPSALWCPPPLPLPELPKPLETKLPIKWLGDDGANCFIEVQGQLVCVAYRWGPLSYELPARGEVKGFSQASRLRLFKQLNRLDFDRAGRSTFMTFTWRDDLGRPNGKRLAAARSAFQKSIERMTDTEIPGLWRVEWKLRQTGRYAGQPMPHVHVIYFRIPYLEKEQVTSHWARAIGCVGQKVSVKMNEIKNLRMACYYVGKYVAKVESGNLDITSYLAGESPGRAWGVYRKNRLPVAERHEMRVFPSKLVDDIRRVAKETYDKISSDTNKGFTVFGSVAEKVQALIDDFCRQENSKVIDL